MPGGTGWCKGLALPAALFGSVTRGVRARHLTGDHFHLCHHRRGVIARHPWSAACQQLLCAQRAHGDELIGVDVGGAGHHVVLSKVTENTATVLFNCEHLREPAAAMCYTVVSF